MSVLLDLKRALEEKVRPIRLAGLTKLPSKLIEIGVRRNNLVIVITDELLFAVMKEANRTFNERVRLKASPLSDDDYCNYPSAVLKRLQRLTTPNGLVTFNSMSGVLVPIVSVTSTASSIVCHVPDSLRKEVIDCMGHQDYPR